MKNKAFLLLSLLPLSLAACNSNTEPNNSGSNNSNGGDGNQYSQVLKDCASEIMKINNAPALSSAKRAFTPTEAPGQSIYAPAIYLYWSGLVEEIEGVTIIDEAINFSGSYRFGGPSGYVQDITFDLSVHFDEENNSFTFLGRQTVPPSAGYNYSYMVLNCDYDFASKTFGGFTGFMVPDSTVAPQMWMKYTASSKVFEFFNVMPATNYDEDADYQEYHPFVESNINSFNTLIGNETILSGDKLQAARAAFVSANNYCDELAGTNFSPEIVED